MVGRLLDRLILGGLLLAIFVAPWPFGSVEFYAVDALAALGLVLLGLWVIKGVVEKGITLLLTPMHWVLLAFLALCLAQVVPLPFAVHQGVYRWNRISLDPGATNRAIIKFSALLSYFFLASQVVCTRRRLSVVVNVLIVLGFAVAVVGILNKLTFNGRILWFRESEFALNAFGPFVNRNHFAGFMELLIPLPLALIVGRGVGRDKWIIYGFMTAMMGTALVLSASRGGILSLSIQLLMFPLLARREWRQRKQLKDWSSTEVGALILPPSGTVPALPGEFSGAQNRHEAWRYILGSLVFVGCIIAGVIWIGAEPVVTRFSLSDQVAHARPIVQQLRPATWKNTIKMIRANPVFGIGLGAYPKIYPHYDESTGYFLVDAAHNDYLQVLADLGIIGGALGGAFVMVFIMLSRKALAAPGHLERSAALGSTVGCIGLFAHSFVDFNLQITANALVFLILVALLGSAEARIMNRERAFVNQAVE
jgi:O-antigen ligase